MIALLTFPVYVNGTLANAAYNRDCSVSEISWDYCRCNQLSLQTKSTIIGVNTSLGPFICHIDLSVRQGIPFDICLGCDWFMYCSMALPTAIIPLSANMVLDLSLSPAVGIQDYSGEFCFHLLIFIHLESVRLRLDGRIMIMCSPV
jgi:hypothetical protein